MVLEIVTNSFKYEWGLTLLQKDLLDKVTARIALSALEAHQYSLFIELPYFQNMYKLRSERVSWLQDQVIVIDATMNKGLKTDSVRNLFWKSIPIIFHTKSEASAPFTNRKNGELRALVVTNGTGIGNIIISEKGDSSEERTWKFNELVPLRIEKGKCFLVDEDFDRAVDYPQIQSIITSFPVDDSGLPQEFRDLINMKCSGCPMKSKNNRLHLSMLGHSPEYLKIFNEKKRRIHSFTDQVVKLYDCTQRGIATTAYSLKHMKEGIRLNGIDVPFIEGSRDIFTYSLFSSSGLSRADYFVVRDSVTENCVEIERRAALLPKTQIPAILKLEVNLGSCLPSKKPGDV